MRILSYYLLKYVQDCEVCSVVGGLSNQFAEEILPPYLGLRSSYLGHGMRLAEKNLLPYLGLSSLEEEILSSPYETPRP